MRIGLHAERSNLEYILNNAEAKIFVPEIKLHTNAGVYSRGGNRPDW